MHTCVLNQTDDKCFHLEYKSRWLNGNLVWDVCCGRSSIPKKGKRRRYSDFELYGKYSISNCNQEAGRVLSDTGWQHRSAILASAYWKHNKNPVQKFVLFIGVVLSRSYFTMWLFPLKVIHLKLDWSQANLLCLDLALNKIINGSRNSSHLENAHSGVGKVRWPRCNPGIVEIKWVACRWLQWDQDFSTRLWFLISQRKRQ